MSNEVDQMTGLEFDLGGDNSFTFGLDDSYKSQLKQRMLVLTSTSTPTSVMMVAGTMTRFLLTGSRR